jgi:NADPH-dependent curcumin reductase CurA
MNSMKAAVFSRYRPPHVVLIKDVEKPVPKDDEVLIKVRAASVNPLDWHSMRGSPYVARMMGGLRKPKYTRLGVDVAGQVEAVGKNVGRFKPGDEVFGLCKGAFAEYACTSESAFASKSEHVTFEQAAAVPVAAFTALQGLRDKGQIQPGQKVLINGASGGVGTFAVQIAKWFGVYVAGGCAVRGTWTSFEHLVRSRSMDCVDGLVQRSALIGSPAGVSSTIRVSSPCSRQSAGDGIFATVEPQDEGGAIAPQPGCPISLYQPPGSDVPCER